MDAQDPVITCAETGPVNRNADAGVCTYTVDDDEFDATATDNCAVTSLTYSLSGATSGTGTTLDGKVFNAGTTTVTWTAMDAAGNTDVCSFTVTVIDVQKPVINNVPASFQVNNFPGNCLGFASWTAPTATDNCGAVTIVPNNPMYNTPTNVPLAIGPNIITYTATDAAGNTQTASFTITVVDTQKPTFSFCPGNITVNTGTGATSCGALVLYNTPTATDNCNLGLTVQIGNNAHSSGSTFPVGPTLVTWTATDGYGNTATCTFTVTVVDNTKPVISCPGNITQNSDEGLCSAAITITPATATDNCPGTITIGGVRSDAQLLSAPYPVGNTTITWTATDVNGNTSTCTQTVTVVDNQAPTIDCPDDVIVNTGAGSTLCTAIANFAATATDNCSTPSNINITYSKDPGTAFPVGNTVVTVTATDQAGKSSTCSFNVTVVDNTPPVVTCPSTVTVNNTPNLCGAFVNYQAATATDNCTPSGAIIITYSPIGNFFPIGTTQVTATATDANGNQSTCTFNVVVTDNQAPSVTCPANIITNNDPGQCGAVVNFTATATDNCTAVPVTITYSKNPGTLFAIGTTQVTVTATDAANNQSTCTFNVTVNDVQAPSITCQPDITVNAPEGECEADVSLASPTASDNCVAFVIGSSSAGGPPITGPFPVTRTFPVGTTTITWIAMDPSFNQVSCTQKIIVKDVTPPTITCPTTVSVPNSIGQCGASVNPGTPFVSDDCSPTASITVTGVRSDGFALNAMYPVGTTTITWTAKDASGNTQSCNQSIVVTDLQNPVFTCNPPITTVNDDDECGAEITITPPVATDNCSIQSVVGVRDDAEPMGALFPVGQTVITWTATDVNGRTAICTQVVNVIDTQNPSVTCPANITRNVDAGQCNAVVTYSAAVTDNCPGATVSFNPVSGSTFPLGQTTVIATAMDAAGNTAICAFTVTVVDNLPPSITCPNNITVSNANNQCGAFVTFPAPTLSDNCSGVTFSYSPASGSFFPVGIHTVTGTATDQAGNTANCNFTVTVNDTQDPVIQCPGSVTSVAEPGQCGANVNFLVLITDNCVGASIQSQTHTSGSFFPVGSTPVTVIAQDAAGNTSTCTFNVIVTDNQAPVPDDPTLDAITGACSASVSEIPTATDNCDAGSITGETDDPTTYNSPGTYTITWTFTDSKGNTSSQTQQVIVSASGATITQQPEDAEACPGEDVLLTISASGTLQWQVNDGGGWDNISLATAPSLSLNDVTVEMDGFLYRVLVTGACGSSTSQVATLTVHTPPALYSVTGGGAVCSGPGMPVGLSGSQSGVNYQLFRGATPLNIVAGTNAAISFGNQNVNGTYTVVATNATTDCESNMLGNAVITTGTPPAVFNVTGGGSGCGTGSPIGLDDSETGVNYQLFRGATPLGIVAGTNAAISFGNQTVAGVYTVVATNATTNCTSNMTGDATITTGTVPTAYNVTGGGSGCGAGSPVGLTNSQTGVNYQLKRDGSNVGSPMPGTDGNAISFGNQTVAGVYTVLATHVSSNCTNDMALSATITAGTTPTQFAVTGGGSGCGVGSLVGLNGSQNGVNYQLYRDGNPVGSPVGGTNAAISFGNQTIAGTYTVVATNTTSNCTSNMAGNASITGGTTPTVFNVTGGGGYCSGTGLPIGLSGSQLTVNYQLKRDGGNIGSPVAGTGSALSFPVQTALGNYSVVATASVGGCSAPMANSVSIVSGSSALTLYEVQVTGTGYICASEVQLSGSQVGVSYQLKRGGSNVGTPKPGTGGILPFGPQTQQGYYSVVAIGSSGGCTRTMTGSPAIQGAHPPNNYTVTGGGAACTGGAVPVGTAGSQTGVNYQLMKNSSTVGSPVAGTGAAIPFGLQAPPANFGVQDVYTVVATNPTTGCVRVMSNSVTISRSVPPNVFTVSGGGTYCGSGPKRSVTLSGSQSNVRYRLYLNGSPIGNPIMGSNNGGPISFTNLTQLGTYTIKADYTQIPGCLTDMSGSATISCTGTKPAQEPIITKGLRTPLSISITAYPNPSENHFNVRVNSPLRETVELRMFDMTGKLIQMRRGAPDQVFRFGDGKAAGMYIIEARQAGLADKATIKVIKVN